MPVGFRDTQGDYRNPIVVLQWIRENVPCSKGLIPEEWTRAVLDEARRRRISAPVLSKALELAKALGYQFDGLVWPLLGGPPVYVPTIRQPAGSGLAPWEIASMSVTDRIGEAIGRSLPYLPAEARGIVASLKDPKNLEILAGTFLLWTGSQFFGVGEFVDLVLVLYGWSAVGFSVFEGARELYDFAATAIKASTDAELEAAGQHFAHAVAILGVALIQSLLNRAPTRAVRQRGMPTYYGRVGVKPLPPPGTPPIEYVPELPDGMLGVTDEYGYVQVSLKQSIDEIVKSRLHELFHRFFTPRTGRLLPLRAELRLALKFRSAFLNYLEEALAEGYSQLRTEGVISAIKSWRFPIKEGYVTLSELAVEGSEIGTIMLGGTLIHVSISTGPLPPE